MRDDHELVSELELHGDGTEDRRRDDERRRERRGPQDATSTADARRRSANDRDDEQRDDRDRESRRDVSVRDLDDEISAVQRREPVPLAFRPVVATAHPRAADADDRAEHHLSDAEDQGENRKTPQGGHVMLRSSRRCDWRRTKAWRARRRRAT